MTTTRRQATAQAIAAVAAANGWTVADSTEFATRFNKGRKSVRVEFSVRGGVTYASTEKRVIAGTNKASQVLAALTR